MRIFYMDERNYTYNMCKIKINRIRYQNLVSSVSFKNIVIFKIC